MKLGLRSQLFSFVSKLDHEQKSTGSLSKRYSVSCVAHLHVWFSFCSTTTSATTVTRIRRRFFWIQSVSTWETDLTWCDAIRCEVHCHVNSRIVDSLLGRVVGPCTLGKKLLVCSYTVPVDIGRMICLKTTTPVVSLQLSLFSPKAMRLVERRSGENGHPTYMLILFEEWRTKITDQTPSLGMAQKIHFIGFRGSPQQVRSNTVESCHREHRPWW